ncbi:MAG: hypothetical protein MUF08_15725 [Burkholderiaceae bacterium]|jgi:hypothetical protein|nr:hypothetical protein [Burkholderiaceae bacterium]
MKALVCLIVLCAGAMQGAAQSLSGSLFLSHDSDSFDEYRVSAGYTGEQGFGLAAGAARYTAPGWSANGALLAATYKEQGRLRQTDASIGVARIDGQDYLVAGVDHLQRWEAGHALGFGFERNIVNSQGGIEDEILFNSLALVGDYVFSAPFNVGLAAGTTYFSDGNNRPFLRTRWNYSLNEQYGLNAYLKTRSYRNSDPDRPQYFSPEWLNEASLGLSSRWLAAERVVVSASLDAGMQYTNGDDQPIWGAFLGLASPRHSAIRWNVGLLATNTASLLTSQSGAYRYLSATAQLSFPL